MPSRTEGGSLDPRRLPGVGLKSRTTLSLILLTLLAAPASEAQTLERLPDAFPPPTTRLLVVSPHPDDETLGAGGLIQRVLHRGGAVAVVLVTSGDGYPEGVEVVNGITRPTAEDYRGYGKVRQEEAWRVLAMLGVPEHGRMFLGFPDGGLCALRGDYLEHRGLGYESPFTRERRPPASQVLVPGTEYRGEDLEEELRHVLSRFRPTVVVTTDPRDQHPDHRATFFFVRSALKKLLRLDPSLRPELLTFLIHFGHWPLTESAESDADLAPPRGLPEARWLDFALSPAESETKRAALLQYRTQQLIMGRFLLSFARSNELYVALGQVPESPC
ncbi:MAG: hypothetical protein DMD79_11115 [Candidatus Rokuibacteriota bacterium]|nr:MAG: hypothetical protein DMD79_11115 [Candidatus Rokubacteria bacterium]